MAIRKTTTPDKWYIIISQGRNAKQIVVPFQGSYAEAQAAERRLRNAPQDQGVKIVDLLPDYLSWYQNNRMKRSYGELNDSMKRLLPHFGPIPAAYITRQHYETYKTMRLSDTWHGKRTSKITINRELKHLVALLNWSAKRGTIPEPKTLPELYPRNQREQESRPIGILSNDELQNLFNAMTGTTRILFLLMFWAGLRKSEATVMTVSQIDYATDMIRIEGKGGKRRYVAIPAAIRAELRTATTGKKPHNLVCPNPLTGFPYGDIRTPLETALKKAGITKRVTPHTLRHTHGTALVMAGASLAEVQDQLGHADIATTRMYVHLSGESARKQSERLNNWMTKSVAATDT